MPTRILLSLLILLPSINIVHAKEQPQQTIEQLQFFEQQIDTKLRDLSVSDLAYGLYLQGKEIKLDGKNYKHAASSNPHDDLVKFHREVFCSANISLEQRGLNCDINAGNTEQDKEREMAHLRADSLLTPTKYTQLNDIYAQMVMRNVINPFPHSDTRIAFSGRNPLSDSKSRAKYADALAKQAILNVAHYSLNQMYLARKTKEGFEGYASEPNENSQSMMSIMESTATKWFEDTNFDDTDAFANSLAIQRATAKMQAFDLWMRYQEYKQNERMEALLAVVVAQSVNGPAGKIEHQLKEQQDKQGKVVTN